MNVLGIDIGGANIKLASTCGYADSSPFPMWSNHEQLKDRIEDLIALAPSTDHLAITMTGELADCFRSKEEGVHHILDAIKSADSREQLVYCTDGSWKTHDDAKRNPTLVAASNWHALALFANGLTSDYHNKSLVIDIGSTTVDVIPVIDGNPEFSGATDLDRLMNKTLIYAGVERTSIASLANTLPYRSKNVPVARELFATTADAFIVLGKLPESTSCNGTVDGQPRTKLAATERLARMICACPSEFTLADATKMAEAIEQRLTGLIIDAVKHQLELYDPSVLICTGHGGFLIQHVLASLDQSLAVEFLNDKLTSNQLRAATALAVATLLQQTLSLRTSS